MASVLNCGEEFELLPRGGGEGLEEGSPGEGGKDGRGRRQAGRLPQQPGGQRWPAWGTAGTGTWNCKGVKEQDFIDRCVGAGRALIRVMTQVCRHSWADVGLRSLAVLREAWAVEEAALWGMR